MKYCISAVALFAISFPFRIWAQNAQQSLAGASIEDLLNAEVTSVNKKEQALSRTGAAIYVITQEDIRRSAANNIPDLLRMVPGVEVAQIDSNQWAISIRGFNAFYSNKVLVLIDGRSIYVDGFSGVYWDQVNVPLEDIDRIEVIRGPGGTIWGANAVNGVINIITKSSAETKGGLVVAESGTRENAGTLVQYGGDLGSAGAYRVYGRYFNTEGSVFPGGTKAPDGWHDSQGGFRTDIAPTARDTLSVQGDVVASRGGDPALAISPAPLAEYRVNNPMAGTTGDVLGRWVHTLANGSETTLQIYDSAMEHDDDGIRWFDNTLDFEFEHHLQIGSRHDLVWGGDYRVYRDDLRTVAPYGLRENPQLRIDDLFAAFAQDEIRLSKSVFLTLGSKFEHNAYTGFEIEPSAQMVWRMNESQSLWGSAARAVRQPSHVDYGAQFNAAVVPVPGWGSALVTVLGNPHIQAEHVNDYEIGYRAQVNPKLSVDATAFLGFYNGVETAEPGTPYVTLDAGAPLMVIPSTFENLGHARTYGFEAFANLNITRRWKISPGFSLLKLTTGLAKTSEDAELARAPGNSPTYQPQIRSMITLRHNVEWDSNLKFVSHLASQNIPGYMRLDTRLGWRLGESVEISIVGQNLTSRRHVEFVDDSGSFLTTYVPRSVGVKLTWRF